MISRGLLVRLEANSGKEADVEAFLHSALPLVQREAGTTAWFAVRFGRGEYGIFDVFPDNGARFIHLMGHVPRELAKNSMALMGSVPELHLVSVQAEKLGV